MPEERIHDKDLLKLFAVNQDEAAFGELVRRYGRMVMGIARSVTGSKALGEDVTQAVFLILAKEGIHLPDRRPLGAWLCRVTTRTALDCRKREIRRMNREREAVSQMERKTQEPFDSERYDDLYRHLDALPEKYRLPLILFHLEGKPQQEAADVLGIKLDAFAKRVSRAREKLRKRLVRAGLVVVPATLATQLANTVEAGELTGPFVGHVTKSATLHAAGKLAGSGLVSPTVLQLTKGVTWMIYSSILKKTAAGIMILAAIAILSSMAVSAQLTVTEESHFSQTVDYDTGAAMAGDYMAIGNFSGEVFIYTRSGSTWSQMQTLTGPDGFGDRRSLSMYGDRLAVGAVCHQEVSGKDCGAVFVYKRSGSSYILEQTLLPDDPASSDRLGLAVAMSENRLVASSISGGILVFERSGTTWTKIQEIGLNTTMGLAISDKILALNTGGATFFYHYESGAYELEQKIYRSNTGGHFDSPLSISGNTVAAGYHDLVEDYDAEVEIYVRNDGEWTRQQILSSGSDDAHTDFGNRYGYMIELNGDILYVGSFYYSPDPADTKRGAIYVYERNGSTWTLTDGPRDSSNSGHEAMSRSLAGSGAWFTAAANDSNRVYMWSAKQGTSGSTANAIIRYAGNEISNGDDSPTAADGTDFGDSEINKGAEYRAYTILNTGGANLNLASATSVSITGANASDFSVIHQPDNTVILPGEWFTFDVAFKPSATGERNATVNVAFDGSTHTFAVTGNGYAEDYVDMRVYGGSPYVQLTNGQTETLTTDGTRFSRTVPGAFIENTFRISNLGTIDLGLTGSPAVSISGASEFTVSQQPDTTIGGGENSTFKIRWAPTASTGTGGGHSATVTIASDDPANSSFTFAVIGFVEDNPKPSIEVEGNGTAIANGDTDPSTTDDTDFGSLAVAGESDTHTFTINNIGTAELTLTGDPMVEIYGANAGDFSVATQPSSPVSAGGSTTFEITFDPSAGGVRSATVKIANNNTTNNPFEFAVQGTGTVVNTPPDAVANTSDSPTSTGTLVTISGSDSSDPDNGPDPLTYSWDYISGPVADPGPTLSSTDNWVTATFTPVVAGTYVFELTVSDGQDSDTDQVEIVAGDVLTLTIASSAVEGDGDITGTVSTGRTVSADLTVNLSSSDETEVTVPASVTISSGSSSATITLSIQDDVDVDGAQTATITATATDWADGTADITVNDNDGEPEIAISGNGTEIASGDTTPSTADHTDFGSAEVGTAITRTFTIANTGGGPLTLSGSPLVAIGGTNAGDFTVTTQPSASITAGSSSDVVISFTASEVGVRTATVTVTSNDANEGTYTFSIQGTGLEVTTPALPPADGDDDGCSVGFGSNSLVLVLLIAMLVAMKPRSCKA